MNQELLSKVRELKRNGLDDASITNHLSTQYPAADIAAVLLQLQYMRSTTPANTAQPQSPTAASSMSQESANGKFTLKACLKIMLCGAVLGFATVVILGLAFNIFVSLALATSFLLLFIAPIAIPIIFIGSWKLASVVVGDMSQRIGVPISGLTLFAAAFTLSFVSRTALDLAPRSEYTSPIVSLLYLSTPVIGGAFILLLYVGLMHSQKSRIAGISLIVVFSMVAFGAGNLLSERARRNASKPVTPGFTVYDVQPSSAAWTKIDYCDLPRHRQSISCKASETRIVEGTTSHPWHAVYQFAYSNDLKPFLPDKGSCNLYAMQDVGREEPSKRQTYIKRQVERFRSDKTHNENLFASGRDRCKEIGETSFGKVYTSLEPDTGIPEEWMYAQRGNTVVILQFGFYNNLPDQDKAVLDFYSSLQPAPKKLYTTY